MYRVSSPPRYIRPVNITPLDYYYCSVNLVIYNTECHRHINTRNTRRGRTKGGKKHTLKLGSKIRETHLDTIDLTKMGFTNPVFSAINRCGKFWNHCISNTLTNKKLTATVHCNEVLDDTILVVTKTYSVTISRVS